MSTITNHQEATMTTFDQQVMAAKKWFASPRFAGIIRLYSPRQVAEQQGTIAERLHRRPGRQPRSSTPVCANSSSSASRSPPSVPTHRARP